MQMPLRRLLPLLALLLVLTTAGLVAHALFTAVRLDRQAGASLALLDPLAKALVAAEMVSRERGPMNGLLGEPLPPRAERVTALQQARERTDRAWADLQLPDEGWNDPVALRAAAEQLRTARRALQEARTEVDRVAALPIEQRSPELLRATVQRMVDVVPLLVPAISALAAQVQEALPAIGDEVQGARLTAELREYAGLLGSQFTPALTRQQPFRPVERLAVEHTRGRIDELRFLLQLRVERPSASPEVQAAWDTVERRYFGAAWTLAGRVIAIGDGDGRFDMDPAAFAAAYVPDMNVMFELRDKLLQQARAEATNDRLSARSSLVVVGLASIGLVGTLSTALVLVHRRVLRPLVATTRSLQMLAQAQAGIGWPHGRKTAPPDRPLVLIGRDEMEVVVGAVRALEEQTARRLDLERERDGLIERLRVQSDTDFLTGLPNRRAFVAAATRALALAHRNGLDAVLMLFDVDHFKRFNDLHGHAAGDAALVAVAEVMRRELRVGDLMGRHGGEEFALLLLGCDADKGRLFAERLRRAVATTAVPPPAEPGSTVTISIGLADAGRHGFELERLLSLADAAMYRAKASGRDQVALAGRSTAAAAGDEPKNQG